MVTATYPDGLTRTLMWIPEYKRRWTQSYRFEPPVAAPIGTRFELVAHYDNSEDNWDNPNSPTINVVSGPGIENERLVALLDYTLDDHLNVEEDLRTPRLGEVLCLQLQLVCEHLTDPGQLGQNHAVHAAAKLDVLALDALEKRSDGVRLLDDTRVKAAQIGGFELSGVIQHGR